MTSIRLLRVRTATLAALFLGATTLSIAAAPDVRSAQESLTAAEWAKNVWTSAQRGDIDSALDLIDRLGEETLGQPAAMLRSSLAQRNEHIRKTEQSRAERIEAVREEMAEALNNDKLVDATRAAVELQTLSTDAQSVLNDQLVIEIVTRSNEAAAKAEAAGDWFEAHELYYRLNLLYELSGRYREDVLRLGRRLSMLRLYTPRHLHDLRNQRRVDADLDELPPFNAMGEDWKERLDGVTQSMVIRALNRAEAAYVDGADMAAMLVAGLKSVRTMVTTSDLVRAFPGLEDEAKANDFLTRLDDNIVRLEGRTGRAGYFDLTQTISQLIKDNTRTINIPETALIHEFGNGALSVLDEYTSIIWPDELRQFQRSTEGRFIGVGIHISLDEGQNLKVVTPLEGTPAQRAGVRPGDIIRAVDGVSTLGITTTQAVEKITGERGTKVVLSIERIGAEEWIEIPIVRDVIPLYSVKGWKKQGARETDWDWFIDRENGIGYVRLTQFSEDTTRELRRAIGEMQRAGLDGLILDMRFNPGGLLSEAVGVANVFVDSGVIVSQHDATGVERDTQRARPGAASVDDIPIVVLVNEGTASASEIVAGCLQDYGRAVVVGARSFGKGSVQNVYDIARGAAALKLTTQYYRLPGGRLIHRRVGDAAWGVEPDVVVEMLPQQISEALIMRQDADVLPIDDKGVVQLDERPDPGKLLSDGVDTQLETALLLVRSQVVGRSGGQAAVMLAPPRNAGS